MKITLLLLSGLLIGAGAPAVEQEPSADHGPTAAAKDVATIDGMMEALYASISGPAGKVRDWNRFHSLFHPEQGRLQPVQPMANGDARIVLMTPADYQKRATPMFAQQPFFEKESSRRVEQFGHIAHVFSTYETYADLERKPTARGINSLQMFNDGKRWWVLSITWDAEGPGQSIPAKYLPK